MRFLALALLVMLAVPAGADPIEISGFTLDCPLEKTEITRLGPGAHSCTWPAGAPYKEVNLELVVATIDAAAVKQMQEHGTSPSQLALSNFLGLTGQPEEINKTLFLGSTSARRVYSTKIPRPQRVHVFEKSLPDGGYVMVAVRDFGGNELLGKLLQSIANTFKPAEV